MVITSYFCTKNKPVVVHVSTELVGITRGNYGELSQPRALPPPQLPFIPVWDVTTPPFHNAFGFHVLTHCCDSRASSVTGFDFIWLD